MNVIRRIGVEILQSKKKDELKYFILQLIQAYRYEHFRKSPLKEFLLGKLIEHSLHQADIVN